jgi:hypothetical protein
MKLTLNPKKNFIVISNPIRSEAVSSNASKNYNVSINNNRVEVLQTPNENNYNVQPIPYIREPVTYHLDTPANTNLGIVNLVVDVTNVAADAVSFVGEKEASVTSNGSAIIISSKRNISYGTTEPTGGSDGDIYIQYT